MHYGLDRKLRIIELRKVHRVPIAGIAERMGITPSGVRNILCKKRVLLDRVKPGTLLDRGLSASAVRRARNLTGVENPTRADLKKWMDRNPKAVYYLARTPLSVPSFTGRETKAFAMKEWGLKPSLPDLGVSQSCIVLIGRLTRKEFPDKEDLKRWFKKHPDEKERKKIIMRMHKDPLKKDGCRYGEKDLLEVELVHRNLCGG